MCQREPYHDRSDAGRLAEGGGRRGDPFTPLEGAPAPPASATTSAFPPHANPSTDAGGGAHLFDLAAIEGRGASLGQAAQHDGPTIEENWQGFPADGASL
jgi:hypothetical protein